MSRLGDFESAIVSRLETATIGGSPAFEIVKGCAGGWRAAIRDAMARERQPAAFVGFIEEPTAPEVRESVRGARFVVLISARTLRAESEPRHGDATTTGAFALIDAAREKLDDWGIAPGLQLVNVHVRFTEGDDRTVVYEILYRVWPIVVEAPAPLILFDDEAVFGSASWMSLEAGPDRLEQVDFEYHGKDVVYSKKLAADARTIIIRGELRADTHAELSAIEDAIEASIKAAKSATLVESGVRTFENCVIHGLFRRGGRRNEDNRVVQTADVLIVQTTA